MGMNVRKEHGWIQIRRLQRRSKKRVQEKETEKSIVDDSAISYPMPRRRDWSELPIDVCYLIAERIVFRPVLHKFALACKMWCTVTKEILDKNNRQPPLLFLPYNEKTKTCRFVRPDSHSKFYELKVPELSAQWICGCTNGWLAIMDDKTFDLALFNPLTRVKVSLPRFDPEIIKFYLKLEPKDRQRHPTAWPRFAMKIAISDTTHLGMALKNSCSNLDSSTKNCLVGVIFTHDKRLAICGLGDESWSMVTAAWPPLYCYSDLMFHDYILYAVGIDHVVIVDYKGTNNLIIKKFMLSWEQDRETVLQTYIVMSSGNLLVVERYWLYDFGLRPKTKTIMTDDFIVYKMDQDTETWTAMESLEEQTLFLGLNTSVSVSASDKEFSPWCRANCIYFLDDSEFRYHRYYRGYQWDNGIFNMDQNCVTDNFQIQHSILFWQTSPLWFFP